MRGFLFSATILSLMPFAGVYGNIPLLISGEEVRTNEISAKEPEAERLDSTVVVATRAGCNTPVTYTMVEKEELERANPVNSLPMNLSLQPSVIATNEGGTGLGYSKMTVRGSKGSQINVTLNGISLNDAESQEVFWVNIPALSSLLSSVQLQRGLGTSANGAGAFGASVNMSTLSSPAQAYARAEIGYGSYDSFTSLISAGTGPSKSGLYFNAAYSKNFTKGYIRNAKANVQSAMATLGWMDDRNSLKLTWLMGQQCSGISWNGISPEQYLLDRRYNSAGEYYEYQRNPDGSFVLDENGERIVNSTHYYDNETDNYCQHHLQLNYTHQFPANLLWSSSFNFTKGDGWYDQYKLDKKFSKYGMAEYAPAAFSRADFIINKCMDNSYFVLKSDLAWKSQQLNLGAGLSWSRYDGGHFGKVLWCSALGDGWSAEDGMNYDKFNKAKLWYDNHSIKQEYNCYFRGEYSPLNCLTGYVDLQLRDVNLLMAGTGDEDKVDMSYSNNWLFFNPRAGLSFHSGAHKAYISAALGHREPGRPDIKENIEAQTDISVRPEEMLDVEIGYEYSSPKLKLSANLYFMEYWDILLETGRLSDTGYPIKENVGRGYRRGLEMSGIYAPVDWLSFGGNLTLSLNKLLNYSEMIAVYDENYQAKYDSEWRVVQQEIYFGKTTMLLSPSVIAMLQAEYKPFAPFFSNSLKTTTLSINGKYVGKQYVDNTMSKDCQLPSYFVANLSLTHEFSLFPKKSKSARLRLGFYVNNLFNNLYYVDGTLWYKGVLESDGSIVSGIGIYPQATINFMGKIGISF